MDKKTKGLVLLNAEESCAATERPGKRELQGFDKYTITNYRLSVIRPINAQERKALRLKREGMTYYERCMSDILPQTDYVTVEILYGIKAARDIYDTKNPGTVLVKKGERGGYICEGGLSPEGSCWVHQDGLVFGGSFVSGDAQVNGCVKGIDNYKGPDVPYDVLLTAEKDPETGKLKITEKSRNLVERDRFGNIQINPMCKERERTR